MIHMSMFHSTSFTFNYSSIALFKIQFYIILYTSYISESLHWKLSNMQTKHYQKNKAKDIVINNNTNHETANITQKNSNSIDILSSSRYCFGSLLVAPNLETGPYVYFKHQLSQRNETAATTCCCWTITGKKTMGPMDGDPSSGVVLSVSSSFFFSSYRFTMRRDDSMEDCLRFSPVAFLKKKNTKIPSNHSTEETKKSMFSGWQFLQCLRVGESPNPLSVTFVHPQLLWGWQKHALHDNSIPGIGIYETPGTIIGES